MRKEQRDEIIETMVGGTQAEAIIDYVRELIEELNCIDDIDINTAKEQVAGRKDAKEKLKKLIYKMSDSKSQNPTIENYN